MNSYVAVSYTHLDVYKRQALVHQLEDCGLEVESFTAPGQLFEAVSERQHGERPLSLAVLGITASQLPPEDVYKRQPW